MRLLVLAALVGCYRTPTADPSCTMLCTTECPGEMACVNGFCVAEGQRCEPTFTTVSAGNGFACALDTYARRWCWGANDQHQLDASDRATLVYVTPVDAGPWQAIATGGDHSCGLSDGELSCWGGNDRQQVSGRVSGDVDAPLAIDAPNHAPWSMVVAGYATTCGIAGGRLYCWGANDQGQVGVAGRVDVGAPTEVKADIADWTLVAVGRDHSCGVSATAGLYCWGSNLYGQLGINMTGIETPAPPTPVALANVTAIAAAGFATCATSNDRLYCWGRATSSALGDPAVANIDPCVGMASTPILASTLVGWSKLTASITQLCGLHDRELWCWGTTTNGIGNGVWGSTGWQKIADDVTDVSVGWNSVVDDTGAETFDLDLTCFTSNGAIQCWGDNRYGQLAQGAATMAIAPVEIAGNHVWSKLMTGDQHACGIADGVPLCWGANQFGVIDGVAAGGNLNNACGQPGRLCGSSVPMPVPYAAHADAIAIGDEHTCVLDGQTLTCWGTNTLGQLGALTASSPHVIPGAWTGVYQPGAKGGCADLNGQAWCWGTMIGYRKPLARDARLDGMLYIAATAELGDTSGAGLPLSYGCVLGANNQLSCFGVDLQAQFGRGIPPPPVCGNLVCDLGETETSCASDCVGKRTCTTNSCGVQICNPRCGDNACNYGYGETCSTCAADCGVCPFVALNRTYNAISVGVDSRIGFTCGIRPDTRIECWGRNNTGQAGALDASAKLIDPVYVPTTIENLENCTAVSAGSSSACALCGGDIYCWGYHRLGAVGAGPTTAFPITMPRKVEIALDDGDRWAELHPGPGYNCARSEGGRAFCWGFDAQGVLGTGGTSMNVPVAVQITP